MATEDPTNGSLEAQQTEMAQDQPSTTGAGRKRPRIDLSVETRERKRGKTMFGLLVGTLNKARTEDKERGASDAAKKRQLIEQRLQDKLKKETDSVRKAEEAKKDKTTANRKEEELQLKDSIYKLRRTRLPLLANFLSTTDRIPSEVDTTDAPFPNPLAPIHKAHPPPLFYLPAILTPAQESFLKRKKAGVKEAAEQEWEKFREERTAGIEEISTLRARIAEEEGESRPSKPPPTDMDTIPPVETPTEDVKMVEEPAPEPKPEPEPIVEESTPAPPKDEGPPGLTPPENPPEEETKEPTGAKDSAMDVDDGATQEPPVKTAPAKVAPAQVDDDDAVEY